MWKPSIRRSGALIAAFLFSISFSAMATSYQDWWNNTDLSGMGWNVGQQGNNIFVSWYMYDADGNPSFLLFFGPLQNGNKLTAPLRRYYGPEPPGYDENLWNGEIVGTATITFTSPTQATFSYDYDGNKGSFTIYRFTFQPVNMSGEYAGGARYTITQCGADNGNYAVASFIYITHNGSNFSLIFSSDDDACTYNGTVAQHGTHFTGSGTYSCLGGESGTWSSPDIHVTEHALVMEFSQAADNGCKSTGIGGGLK